MRIGRRGRLAAGAGVFLLVAFNLVAFRHACRFMNFVPAGVRTARPESLSPAQKALVLIDGVVLPKARAERAPDAAGLTYRTHSVIVEPGIALELWELPVPKPRGIALVFHGYNAEKSQYLENAAEFLRLDLGVILADFRGSGGSSGFETTVGFKEGADAAAVERFARERYPGLPLIVYGDSMGAAAVLRAAFAHGLKPDAAILESPFASLLETARARFRIMGMPPSPFAETLVFWGGVQAGFNGFAHEPARYARSLSCPTLVIHGERDRPVPLDEARALFANLPGAKELVVVPDADHGRLLAANRELWRGSVSRFVRERLGAGLAAGPASVLP